ncbi:MAG: peptide deformylase [Patescibacteria group bacterium]|mgnify:CR=1 FL=1
MKKSPENTKIVQSDHPALREKAQVIALKDISSLKIKEVIKNMQKVLALEKDGVAIAAPQIGEALRIFLVSDRIMKLADKKYKSIGKDLIFINPEITKLSKSQHEVEEGCLSVRWKYGKIKRATKVSIRGYDETGKLVERGASGLLAQVFQHETDHLDGILFIDKAYNIEDLPPEKTHE